ncbi:MAG: dihydroneopterin aldolase [Kiritimatiellia bacterium]|jgi:FolB domain-containing protein|nr:dihydroneopterin aldolase [Kiritimatiellia bacterium]MDP7024909.1 dihydroneopterin aldolase [Kiritimatiellia bacterium]
MHGKLVTDQLDQIHIRDLLQRCVIGIYDEERREKQDVVINITLHANLRKAGKTDDIGDTVDYKAIKKKVIAMVDGSEFLLVEKLAERIAEICLGDPRVCVANVRVAKPGALRFARTVEVDITRTQEDMQL